MDKTPTNEEAIQASYREIKRCFRRIGIAANTLVVAGVDVADADKYVEEQAKMAGEIAHGSQEDLFKAMMEDMMEMAAAASKDGMPTPPPVF